MQGGVLYGDDGDGQARAQGLAPDLGYVVLPESIEVNGERYSVRTLSNGFTTGDEVLEYIVIPPLSSISAGCATRTILAVCTTAARRRNSRR